MNAVVMLLAGVTQCRLHYPRGSELDTSKTTSWSMPAFVVPRQRISNTTRFGGQYILLHPRIAIPLRIGDGDQVTWELTEAAGETFTFRVHVHSGTSFWNCDILIHGVHKALYACAVGDGDHCIVQLHSGTELAMPFQEMWNGLATPGGFACLYLGGVSSSSSHADDDTSGPSGCGFHIHTNARQEGLVGGGELVQGYFYFADSHTCCSHEILYWGLMEGLEWAGRLRLSQLCICGDSPDFLQQIATAGEQCHAPNDNPEPRWRQFVDLVHISMVLSNGMNFTFRHIPREENQIAQSLAITAIHLRENATICNWSNIDLLNGK